MSYVMCKVVDLNCFLLKEEGLSTESVPPERGCACVWFRFTAGFDARAPTWRALLECFLSDSYDSICIVLRCEPLHLTSHFLKSLLVAFICLFVFTLPRSGYYYWTKASRTEQIKVKMTIADDEQTADVVIQGDQEEVERCRREVGLMEKGMVYVKGLLE